LGGTYAIDFGSFEDELEFFGAWAGRCREGSILAYSPVLKDRRRNRNGYKTIRSDNLKRIEIGGERPEDPAERHHGMVYRKSESKRRRNLVFPTGH